MRDGLDGFEDAADAFTFRYISTGARGLGNVHHAGAFMHREQQNSNPGHAFVDFPGSSKPVKNGHGDIKDDEVRVQLERHGQSFLAVGGFSTHLNTTRLQDTTHARPEGFMIVYD